LYAYLFTLPSSPPVLWHIDMYIFIQSSNRGGLVQCCHRYTKANNKYLSDYNYSKESSFLMYVDANNLYGWQKSQTLTYKDFKWMSTTDKDIFIFIIFHLIANTIYIYN